MPFKCDLQRYNTGVQLNLAEDVFKLQHLMDANLLKVGKYARL